MGAKQLISTLVFTLLLIFFSATLFFFFNGAPVQISHLRENPIFYLSEALNTLSLSWMKPINGGERQREEESAKTWKNNMNIPLEPDLATCHRSLSDADVPVYCCPPKPESEESVIDYIFPDPSLPRRIRRPAHLVDEEYISKYEKAIAAMKTYPYDDPFNWLRQANMHCLYCTGAYNQHNSSALFKIHRSWFFFPWHRIFIHFQERFIGKLIGDDTFALPYWNWDAPPGMKIPDFYSIGSFVDADRDAGHLPEVVDDSFDYVEKGLGSEEMVASNLAFMYNQMVSGAKKVELFMGCPRGFGEEGDCDGPGTIEVAPHNALHTWVGSNLQPERENMGAFYSAARDPIFYSHHANIDRLWSVWKRLRGHEPEYQDPLWLDTYLYFHNENRQLVRIKIRDCLDHTKMGYDYEDTDLPWLNARPKPSIPPLKARQILKMRNTITNNTNGLGILTSTQTGVADFGPGGRSLASTIRVQITRPKRGRSKKEKEEEEEVLVVYGIDIKKDTYVKFDVLINAVNEEATGPECREFAGTFVNVRHGVRLVMKEGDSKVKRKGNLKLGISEVLEDLEAEEEERIWVSLVPRGGTGVNTSVDGIRIEYMS